MALKRQKVTAFLWVGLWGLSLNQNSVSLDGSSTNSYIEKLTTHGYHRCTFCHRKGPFHFIIASCGCSHEAVTPQHAWLPFGGCLCRCTILWNIACLNWLYELGKKRDAVSWNWDPGWEEGLRVPRVSRKGPSAFLFALDFLLRDYRFLSAAVGRRARVIVYSLRSLCSLFQGSELCTSGSISCWMYLIEVEKKGRF